MWVLGYRCVVNMGVREWLRGIRPFSLGMERRYYKSQKIEILLRYGLGTNNEQRTTNMTSLGRDALHYKSDTGNGGCGKEITLPHNTTLLVVMETVYRVGAKLAVKTSRGGQWYLKGLRGSKITYDEIKAKLETNRDEGKFTSRDSYLFNHPT